MLLGTLDNPLQARTTCEPQDLSEDDQQVFACLCETDYCNAYRAPDEPLPDPDVKILSANKTIQEPENVTRLQKPVKINPPAIKMTIKQNKQSSVQGPLKCYTCGDLFNPDDQCDTDSWNTTDTGHVATCASGEVCLLYMWYKSGAMSASVRHCFPKTILLGKFYMEWILYSNVNCTLYLSHELVLLSCRVLFSLGYIFSSPGYHFKIIHNDKIFFSNLN